MYLNELLSLLLTSVAIGFLISFSVCIKPTGHRIQGIPTQDLFKVIIIALLFTTFAFILLLKLHTPEEILGRLCLVAMAAIMLRFARLKLVPKISIRRLHTMTLCDLLIVGIILILLGVLFRAGFSKMGFLSPGYLFGFPAFYVLTCVYAIHNYRYLFPERAELATWRLVSYAFPEGKHHRVGMIGRERTYSIGVCSILGWMMFLIAAFGAWILGYWFSGHPLPTTIYVMVSLILLGIAVLKRWRRYFGNTWRGKVTMNITGTGIVVAFLCFLRILLGQTSFYYLSIAERALLASAAGMPIILFSVEFFPGLPGKVWDHLVSFLKRNKDFEYIVSVAKSVHSAAFSRKKIMAIQSLLIAGVFLIYFGLPKTAPLFLSIGINELNGQSISDSLAKFSEIASTWAMPTSIAKSSMYRFIFGNQGLVLLFLLWSFSSLMLWADVTDRLGSVPNLCNTKLSKAFMYMHIVLFLTYFSPVMIVVALLIPLIGAQLVGYSLAVIIAAFTFCHFFPKAVSYLLSIGYLLATISNTRVTRDAINLNAALKKDLALLPGIGMTLAKRIINARPYAKVDDLRNVNGVSNKKFTRIRALVRV